VLKDSALAAQPEYRRFRTLAHTIGKYNEPPFVVVKNEHRESLPNWGELLNYVKAEGKKDASVQRYKGLGEEPDCVVEVPIVERLLQAFLIKDCLRYDLQVNERAGQEHAVRFFEKVQGAQSVRSNGSSGGD
jgi:DNA gyrase subunit B